MLATLAFYDITKQNVLTPVPGTTFSRALGEVRSRGAEFDVTGKLTEQWSMIGNYAYTDTRVLKDNGGTQGNRFINVPPNSGSIWTKYDLDHGSLQGFSLGTGLFKRGQRNGDLANTFKLPGYMRWDASVAYSFRQFGPKITTQLNAYNLLNKHYFDRAGSNLDVHYGEPLTFLGSVRVEYHGFLIKTLLA